MAPPDAPSYSYLLGMYLGDGCLARLPRTYQLVIACDARLPAIVEEVAWAILATGLSRRVGR